MPNYYNRKKWTVEKEFKPSQMPKKLETSKPTSSSLTSAVGSVNDQRSFNRVKLQRDFAITSTYKRDMGIYGENPRNRTLGSTQQLDDISTTNELL